MEDKAVSSLQRPRKTPAGAAKPLFSQQRRQDTGATRDGPSDTETGLVRLSVGSRSLDRGAMSDQQNRLFKKVVSGVKYIIPAFNPRV